MPDQLHYDIAEILYRKGINNVVLSPGSRCAPLSISMVRHPKLKTYTISDERSAAFIALGMAERLREGVAIVCTSGTASLNYYPAITEAFYRGIPLISITADRPPDLIDIWDGQTIRQSNVYRNHILDSVDLPTDLTNEKNRRFAIRTINLLINKSLNTPGPVHINVPLREPLYPAENEEIRYSTKLEIIEDSNPLNYHFGATDLKKELNTYRKMMILVGQMPYDRELSRLLSDISDDQDAVIIGDHISNLQPKENFINLHDIFLGNEKVIKQLSRPDILITLGRSVLSKNLKNYLRGCKKLVHWQVGMYEAHDTYGKLSKAIKIPEIRFIQSIQSFFESDKKFVEKWNAAEDKARLAREKCLETLDFSEIKAIEMIVDALPKKADLHLSNSLPTRYLNLFQDRLNPDNHVFCNRGTSGIDGCSSTAVGHALSSSNIQVLITGDLAFFYDRNAFWHNYPLSNLRVILLNNHGGGIFRVIEGPSRQAELDDYFDTRQMLKAENTARDFGFEYLRVNEMEELRGKLKSFFRKSENAGLLEIETDKNLNTAGFKAILKCID